MEKKILFLLLLCGAVILVGGCEKCSVKENQGEESGEVSQKNPNEEDTQEYPDKDSIRFIIVDKLIFEMNGSICVAGEDDSLKLYEEGLRTFKIAGYLLGGQELSCNLSSGISKALSDTMAGEAFETLPGIMSNGTALPLSDIISGDAFEPLPGIMSSGTALPLSDTMGILPVIDSINFYRDIYTFTHDGDSISVLGGSYATPRNHYVAPVGVGFDALKGVPVSEACQINFYNYVNREYDQTSREVDGRVESVRWRDLGKLRRYRIEVVLKYPATAANQLNSQAPCRPDCPAPGRFVLHFYELENRVSLPDTIRISPGESIRLEPVLEAPEEFNILQWAKGRASKSNGMLNRYTVEQQFIRDIENPNLTEEGERYTSSKLHISEEGVLSVDSDWSPGLALSSGGAIYNSVPICVICMPQGDPQVELMKRSFTFPDGNIIEQYPTPFYCNSVVQIVR